MSCSCGEKRELTSEKYYQDYPYKGALKDNMNLFKADISSILKFDRANWILAYTIDTVRLEKGKMIQTGCGPNIEGGIVSLCTCKHRMRSYITDIEEWEGNWIAAFCSKKGRENALFYLMKIEKAYESNFSFWNDLTKDQKIVKSTNRNIFGDIYEPKYSIVSFQEHNQSFYLPSKEYHRHNFQDRVYDIEKKFWDRYPKLLRGKTRKSFIWNKPLLKSQYREHTKFRQKYFRIDDFIKQLRNIEY